MKYLPVHTFFLLLKSEVDALCCSFVFFSPRVSVWFYFMISLSLLNSSVLVCNVPDFVELSILPIPVGCRAALKPYFEFFARQFWGQLLEGDCGVAFP